MATYSVSVRLQRITKEYAYVNVPITAGVTTLHDDGITRLNGAAVMARAVEMGQETETAWQPEQQRVELHPIQKMPDQDEGGA